MEAPGRCRTARRRAEVRRASRSTSAPARCRRPSASGAVGTTARIAPVATTLKNAKHVPSTNATPATSQIERQPVEHDRGGEHGYRQRLRPNRRRASGACGSSGRQRLQRAGRREPHGTTRAKPTMPALDGECVNASTSSGYAIAVDCVPAAESSWPVCSRMKSRLRRSGTSRHSRDDSNGPCARRMFQIAELSYAWAQPRYRDRGHAVRAATGVDLRLRDAVGSDAPVQLRVGAAGVPRSWSRRSAQPPAWIPSG